MFNEQCFHAGYDTGPCDRYSNGSGGRYSLSKPTKLSGGEVEHLSCRRRDIKITLSNDCRIKCKRYSTSSVLVDSIIVPSLVQLAHAIRLGHSLSNSVSQNRFESGLYSPFDVSRTNFYYKFLFRIIVAWEYSLYHHRVRLNTSCRKQLLTTESCLLYSAENQTYTLSRNVSQMKYNTNGKVGPTNSEAIVEQRSV